MIQNYLLTIILNVIIVSLLLYFAFAIGKAFRSLLAKFDMLNDYMKTVITQYAENVSYSQAVLLLSIFSKAAKYKIYSVILEELEDMDSRNVKAGDVNAKILIFIESTVREIRTNLGAFKYGNKHLSSYMPAQNIIDELGTKVIERLKRKTAGTAANRRAKRYEMKEILNEVFDSITINE